MSELTETLRLLEGLNDKVGDEALLILLANAEKIAQLARMRVRVKTGKLRNTIEVQVIQNDKEVKKVTVKAGGLDVDYAGIVESKYPFLSPSVKEVLPDIQADLRTKIQGVIDSSVSS
jgi:hypothetical protein